MQSLLKCQPVCLRWLTWHCCHLIYGILEKFLRGAEAVQKKKTFWVHLFAPTRAVKKKKEKKERKTGWPHFFFFLDLHLAEWSALSRSCYADAIYSRESCLDVNAALCSLPQAKLLCTCRSTGFPLSPVTLMAASRWSSTVNKVLTVVCASVLLFPGKIISKTILIRVLTWAWRVQGDIDA